MKISELRPTVLWDYFYQISQIPRISKKEEKIIQFIKEFAEKNKLECLTDDVGNVLIRKPASIGMENHKTVALQAHLDMVPQKEESSNHDFDNDPIQIYIDNDWVTATETTLGADNGIGVAAALNVLEATDIQHPPLEALFTIDEETGMTGAFNLKPDWLKADILLNMDSEDEGELYIGCAGGIDTVVRFDFVPQTIKADFEAYKIKVSGLQGGHSGLDIILKKGNANKIINKILIEASLNIDLQIANITGGSLRNAIPRDAEVVVLVSESQSDKLISLINKLSKKTINEFKEKDPGLQITIEKTDIPVSYINSELWNKISASIENCPNGVVSMKNDMPNVVETSTNLATIKTELSNKDGLSFVEIGLLHRSSCNIAKQKLCDRMRAVFENEGGNVKHEGNYPGWDPNPNSEILKSMKEIYKLRYGKTPKVKVIHAGLECGIIGSMYPKMDMVSFGPTIRNPHSPSEKVNIATVAKFWDLLIDTLKSIPKK